MRWSLGEEDRDAVSGWGECASSFRGQKHPLLPAPHPGVCLQTDRRQGHPR